MRDALSILIVEDEALLRMQLAFMVEDAGHAVAGTAASYDEALAAIARGALDVALVDVHLADGPSGLDVGRALDDANIPFLFVTANAARIPSDFCGAWGVIDKPYGEGAMAQALGFLKEAVFKPPPPMPAPNGIHLSPAAAQRWGAS